MIRQYFPRYSGKREVCSESMTKFSPIQIFLYETRLYRGNAILEILYSRLKKKLETAECWSIKSIWFRAELNFCPKIVAGRQECIAKKEVWERRSHTKHTGRLIRLQEFPHRIFLFHFSATVLYTRKNCHLFIYAAPVATRRN